MSGLAFAGASGLLSFDDIRIDSHYIDQCLIVFGSAFLFFIHRDSQTGDAQSTCPMSVYACAEGHVAFTR